MRYWAFTSVIGALLALVPVLRQIDLLEAEYSVDELVATLRDFENHQPGRKYENASAGTRMALWSDNELSYIKIMTGCDVEGATSVHEWQRACSYRYIIYVACLGSAAAFVMAATFTFILRLLGYDAARKELSNMLGALYSLVAMSFLIQAWADKLDVTMRGHSSVTLSTLLRWLLLAPCVRCIIDYCGVTAEIQMDTVRRQLAKTGDGGNAYVPPVVKSTDVVSSVVGILFLTVGRLYGGHYHGLVLVYAAMGVFIYFRCKAFLRFMSEYDRIQPDVCEISRALYAVANGFVTIAAMAQILNWKPELAAHFAAAFILGEVVYCSLSPMVFVYHRLLAFDDYEAMRENIALVNMKVDSEGLSNEARRKFLRYVFHEVRVPFNSIVLGLDALASSRGLQKDDKESLSMMRSAADSMTTIMNAVLTLSAIEAGSFSIFPGPACMGETISHLLHQMHPWASSARVEVTTYIDPLLPMWVVYDKHRILQVISNFVSNALKFVDQAGTGKVAVRVLVDRIVGEHDPSSSVFLVPEEDEVVANPPRIEPVPVSLENLQYNSVIGLDGPARPVKPLERATLIHTPSSTLLLKRPEEPSSFQGFDWSHKIAIVRIEVTDNGVGLSPMERAKLFQPFHQVESGEFAKRAQGTGLGLAISREIVNKHGGAIGAKSILRAGSTFFCVLPLPVLTASSSALTRAPRGPRDGSGKQGWRDGSQDGNVTVGSSDSDVQRRRSPLSHGGSFVQGRKLDSHYFRRPDQAPPLPSTPVLGPQKPKVLQVPGGPTTMTVPRRPRTASSPSTTSPTRAAFMAQPLLRSVSAPTYNDGKASPPTHIELAATKGVSRRIQPRELDISPSEASRDGLSGSHTRPSLTTGSRSYPPTGSSAGSEYDGVSASGRPALKFLLVDDVGANRILLQRVLKSQYTDALFDQASNGEEAIALVQTKGIGYYHVVCMDAEMPVMDGFEAVRRIRAMGASNVLIIGCTGNALIDDQRVFMEAGVDCVTIKPLSLSLLIKEIENYLEKQLHKPTQQTISLVA